MNCPLSPLPQSLLLFLTHHTHIHCQSYCTIISSPRTSTNPALLSAYTHTYIHTYADIEDTVRFRSHLPLTQSGSLPQVPPTQGLTRLYIPHFPLTFLRERLDTRRKLPSYTRLSPVALPTYTHPHRHTNRAISSIQGSPTTTKPPLPASSTRTSSSSPVSKPYLPLLYHHLTSKNPELEAQLAPIPLTSTGTNPIHKQTTPVSRPLNSRPQSSKTPPTYIHFRYNNPNKNGHQTHSYPGTTPPLLPHRCPCPCPRGQAHTLPSAPTIGLATHPTTITTGCFARHAGGAPGPLAGHQARAEQPTTTTQHLRFHARQPRRRRAQTGTQTQEGGGIIIIIIIIILTAIITGERQRGGEGSPRTHPP